MKDSTLDNVIVMIGAICMAFSYVLSFVSFLATLWLSILKLVQIEWYWPVFFGCLFLLFALLFPRIATQNGEIEEDESESDGD